MSTTNTYLKNAMLIGGGINPVATNTPKRYADRQKQYFDGETRWFTQERAQYSSDFVTAEVQGIDADDPWGYGTYRMRFTDVVRPSSAIQRHFDDYKQFLFESRKVEYVRPGTKIITMGSTWLVTNPVNVSGSSGSGICRRCNAVWNYLDYYGNVVSEPIVVENERANANDSDQQSSLLITKGYFNVICQYNDATRQIDTNTRFILGTAAYRVTGYSDFETEFTGDYGTVRLLSFTARYEEPNAVIDDMENHVAGGKTFSWNISITAQSSLRVGATAQFAAQSTRSGENVSTTDDNPITYLWASSDENVLTVDGNGAVTAISEGEAEITATLEQNPNYSASMTITVTDSEDGVEFMSSVPETLSAYDAVTISAAYYEDGTETDEPLEWTIAGADSFSYSYEVAEDGKSVEIICYGYSAKPLKITAEYGDYSAEAEIAMGGI